MLVPLVVRSCYSLAERCRRPSRSRRESEGRRPGPSGAQRQKRSLRHPHLRRSLPQGRHFTDPRPRARLRRRPQYPDPAHEDRLFASHQASDRARGAPGLLRRPGRDSGRPGRRRARRVVRPLRRRGSSRARRALRLPFRPRNPMQQAQMGSPGRRGPQAPRLRRKSAFWKPTSARRSVSSLPSGATAPSTTSETRRWIRPRPSGAKPASPIPGRPSPRFFPGSGKPSWPTASSSREALGEPFSGFVFPRFEAGRKSGSDAAAREADPGVAAREASASSSSTLRSHVLKGAAKRYPAITDEVKARIDRELALIESKGFSDYFLVVEDIVKQASRICGRGSAAASIVSYCLRITEVDPLRHSLYFERFFEPRQEGSARYRRGFRLGRTRRPARQGRQRLRA